MMGEEVAIIILVDGQPRCIMRSDRYSMKAKCLWAALPSLSCRKVCWPS